MYREVFDHLTFNLSKLFYVFCVVNFYSINKCMMMMIIYFI